MLRHYPLGKSKTIAQIHKSGKCWRKTSRKCEIRRWGTLMKCERLTTAQILGNFQKLDTALERPRAAQYFTLGNVRDTSNISRASILWNRFRISALLSLIQLVLKVHEKVCRKSESVRLKWNNSLKNRTMKPYFENQSKLHITTKASVWLCLSLYCIINNLNLNSFYENKNFCD